MKKINRSRDTRSIYFTKIYATVISMVMFLKITEGMEMVMRVVEIWFFFSFIIIYSIPRAGHQFFITTYLITCNDQIFFIRNYLKKNGRIKNITKTVCNGYQCFITLYNSLRMINLCATYVDIKLDKWNKINK